MENIIGAADKEQQIEVPEPNQSSESIINRTKEKSLGVPTPFKGEVFIKKVYTGNVRGAKEQCQ